MNKINKKVFENYNKFKKFISKLNTKSKYYNIELKDIKDLYIEDDIDFLGELIFNNCNIKSIKGCFNINKLIINNCKNLVLIELYTSIKKLTINFKQSNDKIFEIIGNYLNLKKITILHKNIINNRRFYFDGEFNKDIIIEGDDLNYITFKNNILNIKNMINEEITLHNIDIIKNINKINNCNYKKLKSLKLENCNNFTNFNNLINLKKLIIDSQNIKEIPDNLINLKTLILYKCKNIKKIPKNLINLQEIDLCECNNIKEIPKDLINLQKIKLYECKIKEIPKDLINLQKIDLCECNNIKEIPKNLINLKEINLHNCYKIKEIPLDLINLEYLSIIGSYNSIYKKFINNENNYKKIKKIFFK